MRMMDHRRPKSPIMETDSGERKQVFVLVRTPARTARTGHTVGLSLHQTERCPHTDYGPVGYKVTRLRWELLSLRQYPHPLLCPPLQILSAK